MAEVNATQLRDALAWATNDQRTEEQTPGNPWEWFWQAIQGDFNENRSTGQIVVDAAISMIPLVDQVCDVRDLIANCKKLREDPADSWSWLALALTLIGLFPFLGSLVKGVLKVFFAFVRRADAKTGIADAVDKAMTWVISLLRREAFQRYLNQHKVDEVFSWLAREIKAVKQRLTTAELLRAFDTGLKSLAALVAKVEHVPLVGAQAKRAYDNVAWVRTKAQQGLSGVATRIDAVFDTVVMRLERQTLLRRSGIVDVDNVHFRGALPEAAAVTLMRGARPKPSWLSEGTALPWPPASLDDVKAKVATGVKEGWPRLDRQNIESFHKLVAAEIKGPARLYRIVAPNGRAMSDCWVSEKVFKELQNAPDPRAAWRQFLGVWPDWNVNGQFVIYDVKPGETLKVWRGPAASQQKEALPNHYLEGGGEQIVFNIDRSDVRNDVMRYYKARNGKEHQLHDSISTADYEKLTKTEKDHYMAIREAIHHPNISGPFTTGWGYTDFEGAGLAERIGLPSLPGQITAIRN